MSMSLEQIMEFARQQWGEGLEPSQGNIHEAAVGLVSNWYRNTNAVETLAHAEGPWSDEDMLRKNAWATELARLAITAVAERVDDLAAVQALLESLLDDLRAMLPTDESKSDLRSEKQGAPALATDWIATNGLGNWLAFLTKGPLYPSSWWGTPRYPEIVDQVNGIPRGVRRSAPSIDHVEPEATGSVQFGAASWGSRKTPFAHVNQDLRC